LPVGWDGLTLTFMEFNSLPPFSDMPSVQQSAVAKLARRRVLAAGEVLFYEGDPPDEISLLSSGQMSISRGAQPGIMAGPGQILDMGASLAGLPHGAKATAVQACEIVSWSASDLWRLPGFEEAARRALGRSLKQVETCLAEISAPIHYTAGARVAAGPFAFNDTTLLIAFCDAERDVITALLPDGLNLLAAPKQSRVPVFVGLAEFPDAHPEHDPRARFAYTETTCFVPVRCGITPGVFIPYIYPSAWEPILIGREIYGFPKQLGHTKLGSSQADLSVDGVPQLQLGWNGLESSDEVQLVGALMAWLGVERHIAAAAFQAGDVLRMAMNLPPYRRVDVFNRKQVLAVDGTAEAPVFAVDHLTHAVFGVKRWFGISRMTDPFLTISHGPLAEANLKLREAYRTQLDMRLSICAIVAQS